MKPLLLTALLLYGVFPAAADDLGATPLHDAVWLGQLEAVRSLVAAGADVNARDNKGRSPLHYATLEPDTSKAQALIEAGANLDARDNDGTKPVDLAAEKSMLAMVGLLTSAARKKHAHEVAPPARERSRERSRS